MASFDPRGLLRLLALSALWFGGLFALALVSGFAIGIEQAIATVAAGLMTAVSPADLYREVVVHPSAGQLQYQLTVVSAGKSFEVTATHPLHAQNLLLFTALVLATPRLGLRTRLWALGLGLLGVFAIDVLFVMGDLWRVELKFMPDVRDRIEFGPALLLAKYVARMHPTGALFFALPFVWALAVVGPLRAVPSQDRGPKAGRDGPRKRGRRGRAAP